MSYTHRKILSLFGSAVALGTVVFSSIAPAQAAWTMGCPTKTICVYRDLSRTGTSQLISGYANRTNLNQHLHDHATSWTNANDLTSMAIGEWRNGKEIIGQVLPPGWYEDDLRTVNFNDRADWVKRV